MKLFSTLTTVGTVLLLAACSTSGDAGVDKRSSIGFWSSESAQPTAAHAAIDDALSDELLTVLASHDSKSAIQAQANALEGFEDGASVNWRNRSSGIRGVVTSGPVYYINEKACRDYKHIIYLRDYMKTFKGAACKEGKEWALLG
ncbi:hypothetical protein E1162_07320 [Rhodobacteraceae bacterium RKSG542]|uniref:RT0821/Lpp0805 family surface protein n=1 Tax=Pseudovibrio flavus TaxID=2529854 RepID=UPI0012BC23DA|nr:RT0821/Lpp0805 family surface protein [Pseudovibrio flavus]MTI17047.1 hypothetical protein [Pseudovibrio flavus]